MQKLRAVLDLTFRDYSLPPPGPVHPWDVYSLTPSDIANRQKLQLNLQTYLIKTGLIAGCLVFLGRLGLTKGPPSLGKKVGGVVATGAIWTGLFFFYGYELVEEFVTEEISIKIGEAQNNGVWK